MRQKSMDSHRTYALSIRGRPQVRNKIKSLGGRSKFPRKYLGNTGNVVKLGIIRNIASVRMLIKQRDLMMPLP
jgi:hypothetical protein